MNHRSTNKTPPLPWHHTFLGKLYPHTEKERQRLLRNTLILHFRPPTVNARTLRLTLSWGLGGMAVTLVLLQMATGVLLKFVYVPTPVDAYGSVQAIVTMVPFGRLVRNLHHWCANFLVVVLVLHMLRIVFTGAFQRPRQFNWIVGLALLALVLAANLSGYLLPYDQLAYWAVTVVTATLGYIPVVGGGLKQFVVDGPELGSHTLPFFFSLHTAVLPILLAAFMGLHFWRIRKAGGLVVPRQPDEPIDPTPLRVPAIPNLFVREITAALAVTAVAMVVALLWDASLAAPANPGLSPNPVRAPWYFAGFQEPLLHLHPVAAVTVIPLAVGLFLVSIPYLAYPHTTAGIWFASTRGKRQAVTAAIATLIVTAGWIVADALLAETTVDAVWLSPLLRNGILPLIFAAVLIAGCVFAMRKKWAATLNEIVQSLFAMLMAAWLMLTVVGVFFRGASMKLVWPF
jgi:quinol-cytochrome oxidoreductase complex cytochrome b subunit